jgi:hypothetical protein
MDTWGTVPDWLTTGATAGALGAAIWAGVTAKRLYDIEAKRDLVHEEERQSLQAQGVAVWCAAEIPSGEEEPRSWGLVLQNTSHGVIYDVSVRSTRKTWENDKQTVSENAVAALTVLPPGTYYLAGDTAGKYRWGFAKDVGVFQGEIRPITKSSQIQVVALSFRDAANRKWTRTKSGELTQMGAASPE